MKKSVYFSMLSWLDGSILNPQVEMEIQSLQSIYPDECKIIRKEKGIPVIAMYVPARYGKESYASVNIIIKLSANYPNDL